MLKINLYRLFLMLVFLTSATTACFAYSITPEIDRKEIHKGESFQITFTLEGPQTSDINPDLTPLQKDFTIYGNSTSTQMTVVNGHSSFITEWTLVLIPLNSGKVTIPALRFANNSSKPLTINIKGPQNVHQQANENKTFIDTNVDILNPFVQQQIIYTVRLFYSTNILNYHITDPQSKQAVIFTLGKDRQYQTQIKNKEFQVLERRYAIFPQTSGQIEIESPVLTGYQQSDSSHFGGLMSMTGNIGKPIRLVLPNKKIEVKPIPTTFPGKNWLPAKELVLTQNWTHNTQHFTVGEPITRTITLSATGLTAAQLPEIELSDSDNAHSYRDKAQLNNKLENNNVIAIRTEKIAYIPTKEGQFSLPDLDLYWYNSSSNRVEVAKLPGKSFKIEANANTNAQQPMAKPSLLPKTETKPITPSEAPIPKLANTGNSLNWQWIIIISLAIGWVLTLAAWIYQRRKSQKHQASEIELTTNVIPIDKLASTSLRHSKQRLKQACETHDCVNAKNAMLDWARYCWPNTRFHNLQTVYEKVQDPELQQQIQFLDKVLYANSPNISWHGGPLWKFFSKYNPSNYQDKSIHHSVIPPLYPNTTGRYDNEL